MGFPQTESVVEMLMEEVKACLLSAQLILHAVFLFKVFFSLRQYSINDYKT